MPPSTHNSNHYCRAVLGGSARRDQEHESPFGTAHSKPSFWLAQGLAKRPRRQWPATVISSRDSNILAIKIPHAAVVF